MSNNELLDREKLVKISIINFANWLLSKNGDYQSNYPEMTWQFYKDTYTSEDLFEIYKLETR